MKQVLLETVTEIVYVIALISYVTSSATLPKPDKGGPADIIAGLALVVGLFGFSTLLTELTWRFVRYVFPEEKKDEGKETANNG